MVSRKKKSTIYFAILGVVFLLPLKNTIAQTKHLTGKLADSVEVAYRVSNWEKVIKEGNDFLSSFATRKLELDDSLLVTMAMKVSYQVAVANAFLGKVKEALEFAKIDIVKDSLFKKQAYYKQYFQHASSGCIFLIENKFDESGTSFRLARNIAFEQLGGNKDVCMDASKNLIAYYVEKSEFSQAKKELLHILTSPKTENNDSLLLAEIYHSMFLVYYSDKDFLSALHCSETSLAFMENHVSKKNAVLLAKVNQALGMSYYQMQQYNLAKKYLLKAIDIHSVHYYQKNPDIALTYNYLGRVYRMLSEPKQAIKYKTKANAIFEELNKSYNAFWSTIDDPFLIKSFEPKLISKDENPEAVFYELLTDYDFVFTHLPAKYLKSSSQTRGKKDNSKIYQFARQKDYSRLIPLFKILLRNVMRQRNSGQMNTASAYQILGNMFLANNQFDSATSYYKRALNEQLVKPREGNFAKSNNLSKFKYTPQLIETLTGMANCYYQNAESISSEKASDYQHALDYYLLSDSLAEELEHYFENDQDKLALIEQKKTIYNSVIDVLFSLAQQSVNIDSTNSNLRKAFIYSQKSKTNQLKELIIKSDATRFKELHNSELKKEQNLRKKETFIERQTEPSNNDFELLYYFEKANEQKYLNNDSGLVEKYKSERKLLASKLDKAFQNYYEFKFNNSNLSVSHIQSNLEQGSTIIDYHIKGVTLNIFLINKRKYVAKRLKCDGLTDSLLTHYIKQLSAYYRKDDFMEYSYSNYIKYSKKLYDILIKPIEPDLENTHKLIFIVNQELSLLPFETLLTDTLNQKAQDLALLNYLVRKYDIAYNYSCNLWLESKQKTKVYDKRPSNILADAPVFEQSQIFSSSLKTNEKEGSENTKMEVFKKLSPLWGTKKAVDEVCQIAKSKGVSAFKRVFMEANKHQFKAEAIGKKHILIATHGKTDIENPQFSGLYFSPTSSRTDDVNQAFLYSSEAYYLELTSTLVVLYACKSGIGKLKRGYGPMSVSRGFMASGSANVMHTLWSINDLSTRDLVVDMYEHIFNNEDYSSSLRKSKLKLIELGIIPFHWAGMVLLGN